MRLLTDERLCSDEILSGKTLDTNTQTLAQHLFARGAVLARTETVADDVATIAESARRLSAAHDLVFCSGGIGPTHDDRTYEAVAAAFGLKQQLHEPTLAAMKKLSKSPINEARKRMVMLPAPAEVVPVPGLWVPVVVAGGNVYVLPGIPSLFKRMLQAIPEERFGEVPRQARAILYTQWREGDIANNLNQCVEAFPGVQFGSYPATTDEAKRVYMTKLTIEGDEEGEVAEAAKRLAGDVEGELVEEARQVPKTI